MGTCVPDTLIDDHLVKAKPEHIAVYLYIRRWSDSAPAVSKIAADLFLRELDVMAGIQYWESAGLVEITNGSVEGFAYAFTDGEHIIRTGDTPPARLSASPVYDMAYIEKAAAESEELRHLLNVAERLFGRALPYNDMNLMMSFYEWYALPLPVIEVMLDYCVSIGKTNGRYLERVAQDWADLCITTVEDAEEYIRAYNHDYRAIMRALGHSRRDPTTKEIVFMRRWRQEYNHSLEMIIEACGRTVLQTGGTKFAYVESILKRWFDDGITTIDEVNSSDKEYRESRAAKESAVAAVKPGAQQKSKFANYQGRDWDFDELERLTTIAAQSMAKKID